MELKRKLSILSDAAKYDVSCSSSGSNRKNTANGEKILEIFTREKQNLR